MDVQCIFSIKKSKNKYKALQKTECFYFYHFIKLYNIFAKSLNTNLEKNYIILTL